MKYKQLLHDLQIVAQESPEVLEMEVQLVREDREAVFTFSGPLFDFAKDQTVSKVYFTVGMGRMIL